MITAHFDGKTIVLDESVKFGSKPETPVLVVAVAPISIFVGPNNSGKSRHRKMLRLLQYPAPDSVNYPDNPNSNQ